MTTAFDSVWSNAIAPPTTRQKASPTSGTSCGKLAVSLSDQHYPFHDKRLVAQQLRMLKDLSPEVVILNGDVVDFYSISSFVRDSRKTHLQEEIDQAVAYIASVREAAPNARIHYTMGNHEERLRRYLLSNAKDLATLRCLSFDKLMRLDDFEVQLHGSAGFRLNRNFLVKHGDRVSKHSGTTARNEFERELMSGLSGHTHRLGRFDVTGTGGNFCWVEQGCLCETNPEYISGTPNWQAGFALVEFGSRKFDVREVRIVNRKIIVDGVDYSVGR